MGLIPFFRATYVSERAPMYVKYNHIPPTPTTLFFAGYHVDPLLKKEVNFLGLRPLAGHASLKLYHVMSGFCMRNVSCAMIWLVRLCMLPTPTPDDAGDASFLGPSPAPTQKDDMGSRARARGPTNSSPKTTGRKPARKRKCNKTP